jgi:hypothetical protein
VSPEFHPLAWWTLRDGEVIGVVALVDRQHRYWKAYIGRVRAPTVEAQDAATIGHIGVHVGESVARALMPPSLVDGLEFHAT